MVESTVSGGGAERLQELASPPCPPIWDPQESPPTSTGVFGVDWVIDKLLAKLEDIREFLILRGSDPRLG